VALVSSPWLVVAVSPLAGVAFAFFYVGTVTWVAGALPRHVQATAQGIFTGTAVSIGAIGGSIIGGVIAGAISLPALFAFAAVGHALGAIVVWQAIGRRPASAPAGTTPEALEAAAVAASPAPDA
jgi:MFS family permease